MKIIGFPIDVSRSQDGRIVRGLRTRQSLIQATLDLIQAGDVEPTSAAIATIAGVSSRALFQHFTSLAELYAAAFCAFRHSRGDWPLAALNARDRAASLP